MKSINIDDDSYKEIVNLTSILNQYNFSSTIKILIKSYLEKDNDKTE